MPTKEPEPEPEMELEPVKEEPVPETPAEEPVRDLSSEGNEFDDIYELDKEVCLLQ